MGARGPKPLPANVHLLKGNPSKLPADKLRDQLQPETEVPKCPPHLSAEAKREWKRITVELERYGLVSQMDRSALAVYCQAYGRWVNAEKRIKALGEDGLVDETPNGYKQIGVWLQISNRAVEQMHRFLAEFGMTPSSRSRVTPSPQQDLFGDDEQQPGSKYFT